MLSKQHKIILTKIINDMKNDDENKILLDDYITLHNVIIALYARNIFRYFADWKKIKKNYRINYDYIRENETSYKLTNIEKKIRYYCNLFIDDNKNIVIYNSEFIDFIKSSLHDMIHDIVIPIKIMSPKINNIIFKYKDFTPLKI